MKPRAKPGGKPATGIRRPALGMLRGLVVGCHPGPTIAVTSGITILAAGLGCDLPTTAWVGLAVLSGQLSIGWSNDAHDAPNDKAAGRWEKPVVRGWVDERTLWMAAGVAAALCVPLSIVAGGVTGGLAHIVAVAFAWGYNLWLKSTWWSWVPYAVSFGLLAPFLTHSLSPPRPADPLAIATLSLLGVGAHLANGIPDIAGDRATGTQGAVGRLGGRWAALLSVASLLAAAALLASRVGLAAPATAAMLAVLATVLVGSALVAGGRYLFPVVMVLGVGNAVLLTANAATVVLG